MVTQIVFEKHATSEDNERGIATGWLPGELSALGLRQAEELGRRRASDGITAVFTSDLARAVHTATIAFRATSIPILLDWRLRECDYGDLNGSSAAELRAHRTEHIDQPYPGGESWRQAADRVAGFVADLRVHWAGQRVLVIGHIATHWGLDHRLLGTPLEELASHAEEWQPGWAYVLD